MYKKQIQIGHVYEAKIGTHFCHVRITSVCSFGGWYATNLRTGRTIRIKSAQKLRWEIVDDND